MDKEENKPLWSIEIGFYPGVLIGARTYPEAEQTTHVLYYAICRSCINHL